jgi:PAS domain S-box-containing protein
MSYHYSPYVVPLLLAAVFSGWVMIYAWGQRKAPNAVALALMAFAITEWLLGYALEIAGADLPTKLFWGKSQYLGITLTPVAWVLFAYYHVNQGKYPTPRKILPLAIIPLVTVLLAFTTESHGLIWKTIAIEQSGTFSALAVSYGTWFWVSSVYSYVLLLTGTVIIVRSLGRLKGLYRGQTAALLVAVITPWVGNILYLSKLSPIPNLDLTPFAFTVTVAGLAWAIFSYQLVKLSPIARDLIVDGMREGLLVLDLRGRIADINSSASRMIGLPVAQAIGKTLEEAFSPWPQLVERFREGVETSAELTVGEGPARRRYEIHLAPLLDQQNRVIGRLLNFHDANDSTVPQPRFAVRGAQDTRPLEKKTPVLPSKRTAFPLFDGLINFLLTPVKTDLPIPPDVNPKWFQARERSFTLILRLAALIGTVALIITPSVTTIQLITPFAIIVLLIWFLGLVRSLDFTLRAGIFLILVYALSVTEMSNFGYSVESFTFFMTLIVTAVLLLGRKGGLLVFFISLLTMGTFGVLIGQGNYLPQYAYHGIITPATVQRGLTSLVAFSASAAALIASTTILMESLNKAWQMETQALNLLQQERDLLEQRVAERTSDLAEARDEAVTVTEKLQHSLKQLELAQEGAGVGFWTLDPRTREFEYSPVLRQLYGIGEGPVTYRQWRETVHPEDLERIETEQERMIAQRQPFDLEFRILPLRGSVRWIAYKGNASYNAAGEVERILGMTLDITARKQVATLIQENEARYRSLFDDSPISLWEEDFSAAKAEIERLCQTGVTDFRDYFETHPEEVGRCVALFKVNQVNKSTLDLFKAGDITTLLGRLSGVFTSEAHAIFQEELLAIANGQTAFSGDGLNRTLAGDLLHISLNWSVVSGHEETFSKVIVSIVDITARRRAEEQNRKLSQAVEQSGNTIVITDTHGNIEYINPRFTELTGYTFAEAVGSNPRLLQSGEHGSEFYRTMWATISAGEIWRGEFHNRRKDGSLFWESATIAPLLNPAGKIINYVAVKEDITAQKELQERLRRQNEQMALEITERMRAEAKNEAFLSDIKALQEIHLELSKVETLEDLYVSMIQLSQQRLGLDRVGLFMFDPTCDNLCGTYGITRTGELRDEHDYSEPMTEDHWSQEITQTQNHTRLWENAPLSDEGREIGQGWKIAAALWNGQQALGYLVSDNFISQRNPRPYEVELVSLLGSTFGHLIESKRAGARLQESEVRFRQIVENASDMIYRANVEGQLTYVNPTAQRVLGVRDETEILDKHFTEFAAPSARNKLKRFYDHQFLSRTPNTYHEFILQTYDGREIWIGQNAQIIRENDEIIGFQAVARDITEIKQTQEALAVARDQALEANRLKSQFLAKVSHELRTPLGSVLGYAELLYSEDFGRLDEEQKDIAAHIVESANYLTSMVNELLDEAQIESKNLTLHLDFFSPLDLLKKLETRMVVLAKNKGLDFSTELLPPLPDPIYGDEQRLQQILINLTGNAIKFTKTGQVRLRFFQTDPSHWSLQVTDTGAGIPKEAEQFIFEPFRQVDNAITRENRGTGLGLAIAKQLVELMDGHIQLESEVGQGSTFTVTLPMIHKPGKNHS